MFLIDQKLYEIQTTDKKGRGVFAKKTIRPGIVIGDYLGMLIDPAIIENEPDDYHNGLYYALINNAQAVLPDKESIGVHLINHSCEANIAFLPYKGHILYVSLRTIHPGEELTVNYLIDPEHGEPNFYICHCLAATCKGTWYIHPRKIDRFEKLFDEAAAGQSDEEKNLPFGRLLPKLASYPDHFEDNDFYDLFGSSSCEALKLDDTVLPSRQQLRKHLRESGSRLKFPALNIIVCGVTDTLVIAENM